MDGSTGTEWRGLGTDGSASAWQGDGSRSDGADNRLFVEAVRWLARSGAHWRVLPKAFGRWHTAHQRFNRWYRAGVWERLFKALSDDADFEYILVDSTIVRAHQHSAGAPKKAINPKIGLKFTHWGGRKEA